LPNQSRRKKRIPFLQIELGVKVMGSVIASVHIQPIREGVAAGVSILNVLYYFREGEPNEKRSWFVD